MHDLIARYQQQLNLKNATFTRINHDDAMVAVVYRITRPHDKPLILKICPRPKNYLREAYFLKALVGKIPVPELIAAVEPQADLPAAVLMTCLPGTLMSEAMVTEKLAYESGTLLARIHLNRMPGYGDIIALDKLTADPRIHFTHKFNEGFDECRDNLPQKLRDACRSYYDAHVDLLLSTDGPCIIHRDFRSGNIMVHDGNIQGIIDWASGRAGFAEEDFVPYGWPNDASLREAFLAGYARIRPVPKFDNVLPLLQLSRAIAVIGFLIRENTWQNKHAEMYQNNRQFLERFLTEAL